jgi:hypothetical protein
MTTTQSLSKDLTKTAPRSPRVRLGNYALMARMIDKGRASLEGKAGEYHFACPLDQMLFEFKGVEAEEVKKLLASGATDEQIVAWFNAHGTKKTAEDIGTWAAGLENAHPFTNPENPAEKKAWFGGECTRLGLKPEDTTLFEYLEADDAATFKN